MTNDNDFNNRHLIDYVNSFLIRDKRAGKNMYACPICGSGNEPGRGHDGAFHLYTKANKTRWHCHACGKDGDIFDLEQEIHKVSNTADFRETKKALYRYYGEELPNDGFFPSQGMNNAHSKTAVPQNSEIKPIETQTAKGEQLHPSGENIDRKVILEVLAPKIRETINNCASDLLTSKDMRGLDYLHGRGLTDETIRRYKLGCNYKPNDITMGEYMPKVGLSIIFGYPYGRNPYCVARQIYAQEKKDRYRYPRKMEKPPYILEKPEKYQVTFICEGQFDALTIMQTARELGFSDVNAIAMGGCHSRDISGIDSGVYVLSTDQDETGQRALQEMKEYMNTAKKNYIIATWTAPGKDANEMLVNDHESFKADMIKNVRQARKLLSGDGMMCSDVLEGLISDVTSGNTKQAISTGFPELDDALGGGLYAGLYFLGAISSMGKTTLLLQIADQIAKQGKPVLYYSLEMSARELVAKSLSRYTRKVNPFRGFTTYGILHKPFNDQSKEDRENLLEAVKAYKADQIGDNMEIIEGIGNVKVSSIKAKAEYYSKALRKSPVIFIDYLQILAPEEEDRRATDKQIIDKAVLELKRLSRDLDVPVVAISSINRASYADGITLSSFKESGAIEYTSDVLLGLQPAKMIAYANTKEEIKYNTGLIKACKEEKEERHLVVNVLKNRNGLVGKQALFDSFPRYNLFTDQGITWQDEPEIAKKGSDPRDALKNAYDNLTAFGSGKAVKVADLAKYLDKTDKQTKNMLKKYNYLVDEKDQITPPKDSKAKAGKGITL